MWLKLDLTLFGRKLVVFKQDKVKIKVSIIFPGLGSPILRLTRTNSSMSGLPPASSYYANCVVVASVIIDTV